MNVVRALSAGTVPIIASMRMQVLMAADPQDFRGRATL